MGSISNLFENLMMYTESNVNPTSDSIKQVNENFKKSKRKTFKNVNESSETLLNLSVNLPEDLTSIEPDDIDVTVGIMNVDTDDIKDDGTNASIEDTKDDTSEKSVDEDTKDDTSEKSVDEDTKDDTSEKEESLLREDDDLSANYCLTDEEMNKCCETKTESLLRLDSQSINKLISSFVKDNYKNIDKIVISKAILENNKLTLFGKITNTKKVTENIEFVNKGFNTTKLEGKRFALDFSDSLGLFNVIKESKKPFVMIGSLNNNVLKFESLTYKFKTKISEGKLAEVSGKCVLNESTKVVENAD